MPIIATYLTAKSLRDALQKLGVPFKLETFSMKTSGVYIPLWQFPVGDSPYEIQSNKQVKWFFFYRFGNNHPDLNVGEALLFVQLHGVQALANRIMKFGK